MWLAAPDQLVQRGKGGGLAGAFGGAGGSSPFGSKAGDAFTKFTGYVFLVWLALIMLQVRVMNSGAGSGSALGGIVETQ